MLHGSHDHCGCNHTLRYCSICNVVYCTKCHQEWGNHYYNNYPWYTGVVGGNIGNGIGVTYTDTSNGLNSCGGH